MGSSGDFWEWLWPCYSCCWQQVWASMTTDSCCTWLTTEQIPSLGTFAPPCLTVVGYVPSWTALVVLFLRYALVPIWCRRPIWLRTFAAEADFTPRSSSTGKRRTWSVASTCLALLSLLGIALSVSSLFLPRLSVLYAIPIVPCVSDLLHVIDDPICSS